MYHYLRRLFLCVVLLLGGSVTCALAQPILVTTMVSPPYSPRMSDWEANPSRVLITLQNTDASRSYEIRLSGFAERTAGGVRIETKDNLPTPSITIGPSETRVLNLNDFRLFQVGSVRFVGTSAAEIARTGLLPEGSYRVCVRALDFRTLAPLSADAPLGCTSFSIRYAEEPIPLNPGCGTTVTERSPQLINFQWTSSVGAPAGAQYEFTLVDVIPTTRNPEDAIRSATTPPLFQRTVNSTMLSYGPAEPALVRGHRYAWRVRGLDPFGNVAFRNNGYSATCSFVYGTHPPKTDSTGFKKDSVPQKKKDAIPVKVDPIVGGFDPFKKELTFGCIEMKAMTDYTSGGTPRFYVTVDPRINVSAITGGRIEIWKSEGVDKMVDVATGRPIFTKDFTGNSSGDIRLVTAPGLKMEDRLELRFAQDQFTPKAGEQYQWRFTLNYSGKSIRRDSVQCSRSSSASNFGVFPPLFIGKNLPDTLISGEFTIVVEQWDERSKSRNPSLPSGFGRVKFTCGSTPPKKFPWLNDNLKVKDFMVVGAVRDSLSQISTSEAFMLDPALRSGDKVGLTFPNEYTTQSQVLAGRQYLIDYYGGKKKSLDGIRVFFRDVRWAGAVKPTVILTEGIATYPTDPAVPSPPATVALDTSFTLAIDSLTITPTEATVAGSVQLPKNIISNEQCTRASVKLPPTRITSSCEFYKDLVDSAYGKYFVGNTDMQIQGTGYVVDFSSTQSATGGGLSLGNSWKGVVLRSGGTVQQYSTADSIISNRGYVYARYSYPFALVTSPGLEAQFNLSSAFTYLMLEPYGYKVGLRNGAGKLLLAASAITGGQFDMPQIVTAPSVAGAPSTVLEVQCATLTVQPDMDLYGGVIFKGSVNWGKFNPGTWSTEYYNLNDISGGSSTVTGGFYSSAKYRPSFYPLTDTNYTTPTLGALPTDLETQGMQGVTLKEMGMRDFVVRTKDVPTASGAKVVFKAEHVRVPWMNVGRAGLHTQVQIIRPAYLDPVKLGPKEQSYYKGEEPFSILWGRTKDKKKQDNNGMRMDFTESAVYNSSLFGQVALQGPVRDSIDFERMMFTSTANNAGGQVMLKGADSLAYWGVQLVAKDTSKSAGTLCVKLGVIYLTAAGLAEPKHFAKPFYLTWGELKATGNLGDMIFDYASVGQRFDRFLYTPELVKLSPYSPSDSGYLHTYGTVSVGFWGAKKMSISDIKYATLSAPFLGRKVVIRSGEHLGAGPSDLHWTRNWVGDLGEFNFNMGYDSTRQNGFIGGGNVGLRTTSGDMNSSIRVWAEGSCFSIIHNSAVDFSMGPVARFGTMATVWGCGCISGDALERVVVGGELTSSFGLGASIAAQGSNMLSTVISITPTRLMAAIDGEMFLRVGDVASVNTSINGSALFTFDYAGGYVEGNLKGRINFGAFLGIPAAAQASATVTAEGELDWHIGLDYQSVQGRVAVSVYGMVMAPITTVPAGFGASAGIEAGVFVGNNTPKEKVWVMDGIDGRFGLNKASLPDRLFGFYAYGSLKASVSIFILSGGFELYVGIGSFIGYGGTPGFGTIANVGVKLWGSFLGGLLSASVWGQLQMIIGIPPAFQGTLGVEACALWVMCVSAEVNAGFNANQGFFLY